MSESSNKKLYKHDIYNILREQEIEHEITEHIAVYNMEEAHGLYRPHPMAEAKNLFLRDDKKKNYYLLTVQGEKRVDLKDFRHRIGTRPLSFATAEELEKYMSLTPGSVSPFGLLNDDQRVVKLFLDQDFTMGEGLIGIHPNDNTGTVYLKTTDLIHIIKEHGNELEIVTV